jgi:hypothetical protein
MVTDPSPDVTALLLAWNNGDQEALDRLMPLVHNELRRWRGGICNRKIRATHFKRQPW